MFELAGLGWPLLLGIAWILTSEWPDRQAPETGDDDDATD